MTSTSPVPHSSDAASGAGSNGAPPVRSSHEIWKIARSQRVVLLTFLFMMLINSALTLVGVLQESDSSSGLVLAILIVFVVAGFACVAYFCIHFFMLCSALWSSGVALVILLFCWIPCINLIGLLVISHNATQILRKHGVKVGLLGAKNIKSLQPDKETSTVVER